ncbi:MAG: FHA domain-containing protein [Verrucomicrobiia bacterium]
MNCLHIKLPDGTTRKIALGSRPKVIGSDEDADIILEDAAVSRYHCTVAVSPNGIHVQDLASTTGTRINGRPVTSAILQNGDKLEVGPFTFVAECAVTAGFGTAIRLVEEQFAVGKGFQTFLGEIAAEGQAPPPKPKSPQQGDAGTKQP